MASADGRSRYSDRWHDGCLRSRLNCLPATNPGTNFDLWGNSVKRTCLKVDTAARVAVAGGGGDESVVASHVALCNLKIPWATF